jgi:hypothetical protein
MKKNVQSALAAALLLGATAANAQISFGPKVGVGFASQSFSYSGSDAIAKEGAKLITDNTKMIVTPSFGLMLSARFGNIAVQPALTFAQKGTKYEYSSGGAKFTSTVRLSYVDIPVNVVYTTGGDKGFQVFAGPYIGLGIGGTVKSEISGSGLLDGTSEEDVKFASKEGTAAKTAYFKNPDFGLNFGLGYLVNNVQIQAGYGLGLSSLVPNDANDKSQDITSKNRVIHLTFGYLFNAN